MSVGLAPSMPAPTGFTVGKAAFFVAGVIVGALILALGVAYAAAHVDDDTPPPPPKPTSEPEQPATKDPPA